MNAPSPSDSPARTTKKTRTFLIVVACILVLVVALEGFQRVVHGNRNPTASLPQVPGPIWSSSTSSDYFRHCVWLNGTSREAELSWSACDYTSQVLAEVEAGNRAAFVRDGAKNESLGLVPTQPAGTTFIRICPVVGGGCDDDEELRLVGRVGNGWWEIVARWANPVEPDGPAMRASREQRFARLMADEWRSAAA